ncbi:MAG: hypothetical protein SF051_12085 [Elusimicrobiota bacterium]|nr:hypothetical protein [Elusimicrobiota bacterium]
MPLLLLLLGLAPPVAAAEGQGWNWRETTTPHFLIKHQETWLPPGFTISVERIHSGLRMDLGMFSPWMGRERVNLYLYRDHESYVRGEFEPPAWSNGLAIFQLKAVALPGMKDRRKLLQVMAHETTHLLFEGYFREQNRAAPVWVNEGLAMLQEAESPDKPETSEWYQGMVNLDPKSYMPLDQFFAVTPTKDMVEEKKEVVGNWYVQAYSLTHFLLRKHSRLQFKSFCSELRDGKTPAEALWKVYRYRSLADLDKRWKAWLADPAHKRRIAALAATQREAAAEEAAPKGRGRALGSFKPFATGFEVKQFPSKQGEAAAKGVP